MQDLLPSALCTSPQHCGDSRYEPAYNPEFPAGKVRKKPKNLAPRLGKHQNAPRRHRRHLRFAPPASRRPRRPQTAHRCCLGGRQRQPWRERRANCKSRGKSRMVTRWARRQIYMLCIRYGIVIYTKVFLSLLHNGLMRLSIRQLATSRSARIYHATRASTMSLDAVLWRCGFPLGAVGGAKKKECLLLLACALRKSTPSSSSSLLSSGYPASNIKRLNRARQPKRK